MRDQWGNAILVNARVTLNLKTSEIYSTRIVDVQWWGSQGGGGGGGGGYVDVNGNGNGYVVNGK
jgi:hypothetical protein